LPPWLLEFSTSARASGPTLRAEAFFKVRIDSCSSTVESLPVEGFQR